MLPRVASEDFRNFAQSAAFNREGSNEFSPQWLANLFDEDNLRCWRGDYSKSLSDLVDMGQLKALEKYLQTDATLGLKTNDLEKIKS